MEILIRNSSMVPIYEQIVSQIKEMILKKELLEDAPLPSVRTLSKSLRISALTVKKAYDALETEGLVVTVHGKGSFVAHTNAGLLAEEQRKQLEEKLEAWMREARGAGLSRQEMEEVFSLLIEDWK